MIEKKSEVIEFTLITKHSSYRIFEMQGMTCKHCKKPFSIRHYFDINAKINREAGINVNLIDELKQTIFCGCGVKTVLKNGLVFFHKTVFDKTVGKGFVKQMTGLSRQPQKVPPSVNHDQQSPTIVHNKPPKTEVCTSNEKEKAPISNNP